MNRPEDKQEHPSQRQGAGRAVLQPVTTVLGKHHILWLDRKCSAIYDRTGRRMNRAEILRAFIDAADEAGIELTDCGSEEELKARLLETMRKHLLP